MYFRVIKECTFDCVAYQVGDVIDRADPEICARLQQELRHAVILTTFEAIAEARVQAAEKVVKAEAKVARAEVKAAKAEAKEKADAKEARAEAKAAKELAKAPPQANYTWDEPQD